MPTRLEVDLVLSGAGSVRIGPLRLVGGNQVAGTGWWSNRTAGLAGGIVGSTIGALGGLLGVLVSRGRARRFVLGSMATLVVVGAVALAAGIVALIASQPYAV